MATPGPNMPANIQLIVLFERLGAALSLAGVLLILLIFGTFKRLRTIPNTFIIFASFANLGASIACLIGYSGILAGSTSPLCQAQAFMFELFMQSDPWWSLAMAVNVFMVFFFSADPNNFLRYWYAYFLVCYGVPFIPALCLLLLRRNGDGNVYGNATIWCWIDKDWSDLRIYTYYLPIWVCIALSSFIYIAVGYYVFKRRNQLRNLSLSNPPHDPPAAGRDSGEKDLFGNAAVMGITRQEVRTTTTINTESEPIAAHEGVGGPEGWFKGPADDLAIHPAPRVGVTSPAPPVATTITSITAEPRVKKTVWQRIQSNLSRWRAKFSNMDPVKLAYLRTSFIFAISVFVTWTPSSINRVHDIVRPDEFSFGLNLASSIVLPLQGLWNTIIFFYTSWPAFCEEVRVKIDYHFRGVPVGQNAADAVRSERDLELERRATRQQQQMNQNRQGHDHHRDDTTSELSVTTTLGRDGYSQGSGSIRVLRGSSVASL